MVSTALDMGRAAAMVNSLIRVTDKKALGVSEMICEGGNSPTHNMQHRFVRWVKNFQTV